MKATAGTTRCPGVRDIRTDIEAGGITHPLDALRTAGNGADGAIADGDIADGFARPDAIHMHVHIVRADGTPVSIAVPADLALMGEAYGWLQDVRPLVTADSDLSPEELARLLNAGFFSPSDDADADSWETQHTRFEEEALHMALKLLCSDDESTAAVHRQRGLARDPLAYAARPRGRHHGAGPQGIGRARTRRRGGGAIASRTASLPA